MITIKFFFFKYISTTRSIRMIQNTQSYFINLISICRGGKSVISVTTHANVYPKLKFWHNYLLKL